ncbi:ABC-type transport auxiliary lipoprotein family protein [Sphingomonas sp.]|uniref:ABC-type transport auxiliary lipoprotein family protein n=1 Tax=Sphingomonas sp. TaxID=28214 RepID=UPI002ED87EDB
MKTLPLAMALPLLLGGCIRFGAEAPPSLLTLTADTPVAVGETTDSATAKSITVMVPSVPQELAVARVPVRSSATDLAYLKNAHWVEAPSRLFARLLSDTVSARTGRVVLSLRQSLTDPGARLSGELRQFGIDAGTSEAVVTFDATLVRDRPAAPGGARAPQTFEKRRFEARVPVAAIDAASAGVALNRAANQVAVQVSDWVGR